MECTICSGSTVRYADTSYFNKPVYRCETCNLYISEDDPSIYQKEYWDNRAAVASVNAGYTDEHSLYLRYLLDSQLSYCNEFIKGKKLLEIGSGAGQTLYFMEQKGFDVTGIEPDARNAELINRKLSKGRCIAGYAEQLDIEEKYDIIWLSHVFEHVQKPLALLEQLARYCAEFTFIEVPNAENPATLKASICDNPSSYHFSLYSLKLLAEKADLKILKANHMRYMTMNERRMYRYIPLSKDHYPFYPYVIGRPEGAETIRTALQPNRPR